MLIQLGSINIDGHNLEARVREGSDPTLLKESAGSTLLVNHLEQWANSVILC